MTAWPNLARHFDGGMIEVTVYQPLPEEEQVPCHFLTLGPGEHDPTVGPASWGYACGLRSFDIVHLQAPQARGWLHVETPGANVSVPYLVPDGMAVATWVQLVNGTFQVGAAPSKPITPLHDGRNVVWAAAAAVGFLAVLVALLRRLSPWVTLGLLVATTTSYAIAQGPHEPLPTVPLWAVTVAWATFAMQAMAAARGNPRRAGSEVRDVSADGPRLDAIGLRDDLR